MSQTASSPFIHHSDLPSEVVPVVIDVITPSTWERYAEGLSEAQRVFAGERQFIGETGQRLRLPEADGRVKKTLLGVGEKDESGEMRMGALSNALPAGHYQFGHLPSAFNSRLAAIGWGMGAYRFDRYLSEKSDLAVLVLDGDDAVTAEIIATVEATKLCRDLINTPAGDMGPIALGQAAVDLAEKFGAEVTAVVGDDLLEQNYPMIHAVGRAAHEAPRLVEIEWGDPSHPRLAIIGKGITFDTGGVNMKSASGARLMKKDMGGAAHALALSHLIMATNLPVRLHCLLAIAENAVSANAYRPGDILQSRIGLTVEIDNTDAEGRLVLGDALTKATESNPDFMIDFATLTGAARVALGPHLPPMFCNRPAPIEGVARHGTAQLDPVWNMPLWQPYNSMLSSPIASLKNSGGGFAGSITAALFLERFVKNTPWMHFDTYGWNPTPRPAHPKGGDMYGVRAVYAWLKAGGLNARLSE
ncbi:aminopeptidase [Litorimonas cladophorae]|uniref:Aminopeptidase n=1 Tax=Litorimonas cladophorae TaxID=1220491 RepID=A0A918KJ35_9PROT|nr:leucyl aminopeptidase family protein [Litorimonas cladophorae]GGX65154.1 aminopeptidase [Litorimonas cladophorae]